MAGLESLPSLNIRKAGKYTEDPIKNLPQLPEKRLKQSWVDPNSKLDLQLNPRENQAGKNSFDLIKEINARDPKKYKLEELKPRKQVKINAPSNGIKNTEHLKKNREDFRKNLVDIIMQEENKINFLKSDNSEENENDSEEIKAEEDPKNVEKDILRYYYYIHNGIDTVHVAPLEDVRIKNMKALITNKLLNNYPQYVADLSDEVKDDYLLSVKKAIVDFVLRDSRENESDQTSKQKIPEYKQELELVPKPWHASFEKSRYEIYKNLHSINPCMSQVLKLWYSSFDKLRMIDISEFQNEQSALDLPIFMNTCMKNIEFAKDQLAKKWFTEVQNIFYQGNKRKLVPSTTEPAKQKSFFDAAACLMTANLQALCLKSMSDYEILFVPLPESTRQYEHPGFILRLILSDTEIKYEPSFTDFEVSFLNMIDIIIKACAHIPRVETRLYSDSAIQQQPGLKKEAHGGLVPVILPNIVQDHKNKISEVIKLESEGPVNHSKQFEKYSMLISKKAEEDMEAFLKETHNFNEYEREYKKYHRLVKEITYNSQKVVRVGMFELHCDELIRSLAKRAESIASKLMDKMLSEHFEINKQ